MTLQTGAVALIAAAYGWRLGAGDGRALSARRGDRPAGLRRHAAKGIGLAYMVGPTGGYPGRLRRRRRARRLAGGARLRPQSRSSSSAPCCSATRSSSRSGFSGSGSRRSAGTSRCLACGLLPVHPRRSGEAGARRLPRLRRRAPRQALSGAQLRHLRDPSLRDAVTGVQARARAASAAAAPPRRSARARTGSADGTGSRSAG